MNILEVCQPTILPNLNFLEIRNIGQHPWTLVDHHSRNHCVPVTGLDCGMRHMFVTDWKMTILEVCQPTIPPNRNFLEIRKIGQHPWTLVDHHSRNNCVPVSGLGCGMRHTLITGYKNEYFGSLPTHNSAKTEFSRYPKNWAASLDIGGSPQQK